MTKTPESGLLMHVTSLPSRHGIGDLKAVTDYLLPFLKETEQKWWQILPMNPSGYGHSPYQGLSAFAGNVLWISPELVAQNGWLHMEELASPPSFSDTRVDFDAVLEWKDSLFRRAFQRYEETFPTVESDPELAAFRNQHSEWLDEYALYQTMKNKWNGKAWHLWPSELAHRDPEALKDFVDHNAREIRYHQFLQHLFFGQWNTVKEEFQRAGIRIIGDLPIFVAHDSADVWTNQDLFQLNREGTPTVVAGVPPDYFSETGQRWGNPHYKWDRMKENGFRWWKQRINWLLELVDVIRIDHFRGFEAYWQIAAREKTAVNGRWVKAPGNELFRSLLQDRNELPFIAEDLGVITPEVEALKKRYGLPGMKILQFSFDSRLPKKQRPSYYEKHTVAYTGTHDNDTLAGWIENHARKDNEIRHILKRYHAIDVDEPVEKNCRKLIRLLFNTNAGIVIVPMQDHLFLGSEARMNYPGTVGGQNWKWRCLPGHLRNPEVIKEVLRLTRESKRS